VPRASWVCGLHVRALAWASPFRGSALLLSQGRCPPPLPVDGVEDRTIAIGYGSPHAAPFCSVLLADRATWSGDSAREDRSHPNRRASLPRGMWVDRRAASRATADRHRRGGRGGDRQDLGGHAERRHAPLDAVDGPRGRADAVGGAVDLEGVRAPAAPPGDVEAVHRPLFIDKVRDVVGLYLNRATAGWRCVSMRSSKSRRWIAPRRSRRCCPPPPERATDDVLPALSPRSATLKDAPYRVAGVACRLLSYADAGGSKAPAVSDVILGVPLPGVERLGYCIARLRAASATDMAVQGRHRLWGR
jgi:hypothetical protein